MPFHLNNTVTLLFQIEFLNITLVFCVLPLYCSFNAYISCSLIFIGRCIIEYSNYYQLHCLASYVALKILTMSSGIWFFLETLLNVQAPVYSAELNFNACMKKVFHCAKNNEGWSKSNATACTSPFLMRSFLFKQIWIRWLVRNVLIFKVLCSKYFDILLSSLVN